MSIVFSTNSRRCAPSPTWAAMAVTSAPCSRISAARASRSACLRLLKTTLAPASAMKRAIDSPMPLLAPVTMATFSLIWKEYIFGRRKGGWRKGKMGRGQFAVQEDLLINIKPMNSNLPSQSSQESSSLLRRIRLCWGIALGRAARRRWFQ